MNFIILNSDHLQTPTSSQWKSFMLRCGIDTVHSQRVHAVRLCIVRECKQWDWAQSESACSETVHSQRVQAVRLCVVKRVHAVRLCVVKRVHAVLLHLLVVRLCMQWDCAQLEKLCGETLYSQRAEVGDLMPYSVIAIKLCNVCTLSYNALTLWRNVTASYSYRSKLIDKRYCLY
jgi:hypothetical protein